MVKITVTTVKIPRKFGYSLIAVNFTVIFPEKFYPCTSLYTLTYTTTHINTPSTWIPTNQHAHPTRKLNPSTSSFRARCSRPPIHTAPVLPGGGFFVRRPLGASCVARRNHFAAAAAAAPISYTAPYSHVAETTSVYSARFRLLFAHIYIYLGFREGRVSFTF